MPDILHRVGIDAPATDVFQALTTVEGLRRWWVSDASGEAGQGGEIDFGFCRMRVQEALPDTMVHWECVWGPPEWVGTEVLFSLVRKDGQTFILFSHADWREPVEFMHHCSTKWAVFLLSLKDWIERKGGQPAPRDVKIHLGD